MAFDQVTRNRLSKFVSDTRKLLSDEFAQQMRVKYGLDPATGVVTDIDNLPTMAEVDRQTAQMLRDTLEHYLASSTKRDKKLRATTIDRIVREQAFTVLNRLCAVRMAEARDLVIESIAQGTKSKGFQLYSRLAGSALGETGEAYVSYLFSLFDELSIDLPVLFDCFSPSGRLFPRESVLLEVLEQINHHELQQLWAEDETIGWIYQYFNSQEERKAMRDASSAPRNSRELAVRNQFFTPRYVVEFLTDNTLGRIWYEMTQGKTRLVEDCKFLVHRPDEVFLSHMTSKDQEHPSDGTIAMAELLLSGTEETFPEFNARDRQPMIDLAHCVNAYATMGDRAHEILANRPPAVCGHSVQKPREIVDAIEAAPYVLAGQLGTLKTQHILEVLFMNCRNDRHGGEGSVYSEPWFVDACNEVRSRAIKSHRDNLSQEELIRQPVFIQYRPVKDPREIKMLDPACGSMHFGLYAFDLLLRIYDEAWQHEERLGDQVVFRTPEQKSLRESYGTREKYMLDVPRLILECNIHGIDIDSRAVQIAGLSLWLRAQKAWHEAGIKTNYRPRVIQSNIVCAEPMPGEADLLEQFITTHLSQTSEKQAIASIVRRVFDAMKLAGEAGSLLKIEDAISGTIAEAKKKWIEGPVAVQLPLFEIDKKQKNVVERPLLVAGIDDGSFWDEIEERIYAALKSYAEEVTSGGGFQRRLFAKDAVQGFAFIDVCRKRYDVVVMNPPFGEGAKGSKEFIESSFEHSSRNIFQAFVERGIATLQHSGRLGVLSSRTGFFLGDGKNWRKNVVFCNRVACFADLGLGVLDDALVEVAAYVVERAPPNGYDIFTDRQLDNREKEIGLSASISSLASGITKSVNFFDQSLLDNIPDYTFAYWAPPQLLRRYSKAKSFRAQVSAAKVGLQTGDDFRFARLGWEVANSEIGVGQRWQRFSKGGEYSPIYDDIHLLVDWGTDGRQLKASAGCFIRNDTLYFKPGATYADRTASAFAGRVLPRDCIFSHRGSCWFADSTDLTLLSIGYMSCRVPQTFLELAVGAGDIATSGSAARTYTAAVVESVPAAVLFDVNTDQNQKAVEALFDFRRLELSFDETSCRFVQFQSFGSVVGIQNAAEMKTKRYVQAATESLITSGKLDESVTNAFQFTKVENEFVNNEVGLHPINYKGTADGIEVARLFHLTEEQLICEAVLKHGSKRWFTKKSYFVDRRLEIICHHLGISPSTLNALLQDQPLNVDLSSFVQAFISANLGAAFGRWDIRYATGEQTEPVLADPFAPLPVCPPGQLQNTQGLPARPEDVPASYPLSIPWNGILVDDPNHPLDIEHGVRQVIVAICGSKNSEGASNRSADTKQSSRSEAIEMETCEILRVKSLRDYFRKPAGFFAEHLSRYSKSRRQAPIYWPLSTDSGSYTLWFYYHRLTDQTIYIAVNDFVEPKLRQVNEELKALRSKSNRSKLDEDELERLSVFSIELEDFRKELLRIADFWKPNLNDGVQITAAPLWKFFRLKKWRDTLKGTWDELEEGKYDWAHLALSIWPERVVRTAHNDRSIAIIHDLEDVLWHEIEVRKSGKTGRVTIKRAWQPRELSEKELDAIVVRVKSGELGVVNTGSLQS